MWPGKRGSNKKEVFTIQQIETKQESSNDFLNFKSNVDSWIKNFNSRVNDVESATESLDEFQGNVNHNYELILDVKEKVDDLKEQIQTIKLTQLMIIKKVFAEELSLNGKNDKVIRKFLNDAEDSFE